MPGQHTQQLEGESQREHEILFSLSAGKAERRQGCARGCSCVRLWDHSRGIAIDSVPPGLQGLHLGQGTSWVIPGEEAKAQVSVKDISQLEGTNPTHSSCPFLRGGSRINSHLRYNQRD